MAQASDTNEKRGFFLSELFYPWLCLWTVFVGALFCYFIPICFIHFSSIIEKGSGLKDPSYFVPSLIEKSIASDQVRISLLLSVVIAIPLFVENVLDCLYPLNHADERILWYSKFLVLISLTVPNFLILIRCNGSSSGVGYILAFNYSRMAITGCTIAYASQIALKCRMEEISKFCWVLVVASITAYSMDSYSYIFPSMRPIFQTCCVAFRLLSLILSVIGVRAWLRQAHSVGQPFTSSEVVIFVQLLAAVICSIMYGATAIYYGATNFLETPSECICGYTYIQMLYTVTIMTIPGRIARFEVSNVTQSMRERQAFIRYISHEIRTPLNAVFLGLEFITSTVKHIPILESQASMDSIVETISDVYSSCEVAISILNDLLTFDKIESGKMALEIESINCCSFFNSLVKPFNVNARNKQISFHLDFSELSPKFIQHACIKVDQGKMGQVIRNLISNALKFTPHGGSVTVAITHFSIGDKSEEKVNTGAELNVLSRFHETGGAPESTATVMDIMRLEVRDTGAGISSANLTQLFGQYVQFNANKLQKGDGSGLGLWISKGITELHGGIIGAFSSGEGKGSIFYVELPVTILGSGSGYDNFCEDEDKDRDIDKDKNKESVSRKPLPVLNDCQQKTFSGDSNLSTNGACFGGKIVDMDIDSPMPDAESITSFSEDIERSLISGRQLISMPPEHSLSNTPTCAPTSTLLLLPLLEGVSAEEADDDLEGTAGHAESNVFVLKDDDDGKYVDITTARSSTKVDSRRYLESSTVERKQHSGMSSVSSHSSGPHCVQPLSEKSSIFSTLADLLRETIQNSISESLLSRNDSNDFILSAQPFMVTSMPFSRSIASSRNSGSRVPTRYASLSTTPYYNISSCHTPAKIGSGRNSPNATTGHSTPLYSSPFNSPRTSVLFADSWSHSSHCNSGSRVENLEQIRESKSLLSDYNYNLQPERKSNRLRCGKEVTSICTEKPRALISEKGTRASEELSTSIPSSPFIIFPSTVSHPTHKVPLRITIPPLEKNLVSSSKEQVSRERESRSPDHVSELGKDSARVLHYLVVDDVMMNRRMVIRVLSSYHHRVSEATDGKDCLKVWEEITAAGGTVDVVLMDNSMPIMTGPEAATAMRERGYKGIIIGVTGHAQRADIEEFERCGADAVLAKPLKYETLNGVVNNFLM